MAALPHQSIKQGLLREFLSFLPAQSVLSESEDLRPYECDGLAVYRQVQLLAVLPSSEAEVARILAICHRVRVPVVARGAGTGLAGGATPRADAVLLSLAKLNRILAVDPLARLARMTIDNMRSALLSNPRAACNMG